MNAGRGAMYRLLRPLLFALEAEAAHGLAFRAAEALEALPGAARLAGPLAPPDTPALRQTLWGLAFPNPVGLAAGFDKDGVLAGILPRLGFGFLELGTVTPRPQPGNPRPRLFRLPEDEAVINRMGFNNAGAERLAQTLAALRHRPVPIGVNLGKNRDTPLEHAAEDYRAALRAVYPVADYCVVNISSPNTPGLRELQRRTELTGLMEALAQERARLTADSGRRLPMLIKVAPDLSEPELQDVIETALACAMDGLIAANTTTTRAGLRSPQAGEPGGLSGRPLHPAALRTVAALRRLGKGRLPLVGVGGIFSADDAYAFIRAGASLVQLYTGLIYRGPGLVRAIARGLEALLARDGFRSLQEAVGCDVPLPGAR